MNDDDDDDDDEIVILKIGGSSITDKAQEETLNNAALEWFAKLIASSVDPSFLSSSDDDDGSNDDSTTTTTRKKKFIVVHGAGSFGHFSAKRFGLPCGKAAFLEERPTSSDGRQCAATTTTSSSSREEKARQRRRQRYQMEGLSKTRQSVQKLNSATVDSLIQHGVNAVGISPGMTIRGLRAHGATVVPTTGASSSSSASKDSSFEEDTSYMAMLQLCDAIRQCLRAGLVPVVHGDACLLYDGKRAGILGGDTIAEGLATLWNGRRRKDGDEDGIGKLSRVIFITDVAGVFTSDPKSDPDAELIRSLKIREDTGKIVMENDSNRLETETWNVGGSSHEHDVTGGLKVVIDAL